MTAGRVTVTSVSPFPGSSPRRAPASPSTGAGRVPRSVRYARRLLWLQAGIWALLAFVGAIDGTISLALIPAHGARSSNAVAGSVIGLSVALVAANIAVLKLRLAVRMTKAADRTRKTVIVVEIAMSCLGILMTASVDYSGGMPADLIALAALAGGGLSLAAAIGLLRRKARRFCVMPKLPARISAGRNAPRSGLLPATVSNRLRWPCCPDVGPCYA